MDVIVGAVGIAPGTTGVEVLELADTAAPTTDFNITVYDVPLTVYL